MDFPSKYMFEYWTPKELAQAYDSLAVRYEVHIDDQPGPEERKIIAESFLEEFPDESDIYVSLFSGRTHPFWRPEEFMLYGAARDNYLETLMSSGDTYVEIPRSDFETIISENGFVPASVDSVFDDSASLYFHDGGFVIVAQWMLNDPVATTAILYYELKPIGTDDLLGSFQISRLLGRDISDDELGSVIPVSREVLYGFKAHFCCIDPEDINQVWTVPHLLELTTLEERTTIWKRALDDAVRNPRKEWEEKREKISMRRMFSLPDNVKKIINCL